jgi:hypothetical protein
MRKFGSIIGVFNVNLLISKRHMTVTKRHAIGMYGGIKNFYKINKYCMCKTCIQKTRNAVGIEGTLSSFL